MSNKSVMRSICASGFIGERNIAMMQPIYKAMSKCYGPYGGNTFIANGSDSRITKDGVSILSSLVPANDTVAPLLSMLKKSAARSDLKAGDGTTTVTLGIIDTYRSAINEGIEINKQIVTEVENFIEKHKKKVTNYSQLVNIAKVALNHDEEYTAIFENIYSEMEKDGKTFKDFEILTRVTSDATSNKKPTVNWEKQTGIKTMSFPILTKGTVAIECAKAVMVQHPVDNSGSVAGLGALLSAWAAKPESSQKALIIMVPFINEFMRVHSLEIISSISKLYKKTLIVDFLPMINPLAEGALDASQELATALCVPLINLHTNRKFDTNKNENVDLTKVELMELYNTHLTDTSTINLVYNEFETSTMCIPESLSKKYQNEKNIRLQEMRQEANRTIDLDKKSAIEHRIGLMTGGAVTINISASSSEATDFLADTFQDACSHIKRAKSGLIAGMNIGILKVLGSVLQDVTNDKEMPNSKKNNMIRGLNILINAYGAMMETMIDLKVEKMKRIGEEVNKIDILFKIRTMLAKYVSEHKLETDENNSIDIGFDLITEEIVSNIVSSANNELVLFRTIVEVTNLLMSTNQITFEEKYQVETYEMSDVEFK